MPIIERVDETPEVTTIVLKGEVDMASSNDLRAKLLAQTKRKRPQIVVDMGAVSYVDSSGLATLIEAKKTAATYGGEVSLAKVQPRVMAVFKLASLTTFFSFID